MTRYLARPGLRIPMPGRQGQLVPETGEGIAVDELDRFYGRMIDDGDLVAAPAEQPATPPAKGAK